MSLTCIPGSNTVLKELSNTLSSFQQNREFPEGKAQPAHLRNSLEREFGHKTLCILTLFGNLLFKIIMKI